MRIDVAKREASRRHPTGLRGLTLADVQTRDATFAQVQHQSVVTTPIDSTRLRAQPGIAPAARPNLLRGAGRTGSDVGHPVRNVADAAEGPG